MTIGCSTYKSEELSPTSLANRNNKSSGRRTFSRASIPLHRRALTTLQSLPRRTKNGILIILVLLSLWKLLGSKRSVIKIKSTTTTTTPLETIKVTETTTPSSNSNPVPTPASKHLNFAPTQVKKTSARIRFSNGVVQEVYVTPIRNNKNNNIEEEGLWETEEIDSIQIPLGGSLQLTYVNEPKGLKRDKFIMRKGEGDDCMKRVCEGVESVILKQDVMVGLEQMKASPRSDFLIMSLPNYQPFPFNSITLITQFTLSRLPRFERILKEWDGPISISIYLTDLEDIDLLSDYLKADKTRLQEWNKRIALTIVKPDYSSSEEALQSRLRYPINQLRNLALDLAPSEYVLVIDVDFVPSPNMHTILRSQAIPIILQPSLSRQSSPTFKPVAIVIPTFILSPLFSALNLSYPTSFSSLQSLLLHSPPLATLTDPNSGHGPTLPSLLFSSTLANSYEICWEPQWEPYYLIQKGSHPKYDERFTDQGGDKQSHSILLNLLHFRFEVLRNVWVLHPSKDLEGSEEDWPSKRLLLEQTNEAKQGEGGVKLEGKEDVTHFSIGQRELNRYRYFQNFLPELESTWGWNFRWPRGCSRELVTGWRTFGRSRGGVVFGL